jgi:hypothetical protein
MAGASGTALAFLKSFVPAAIARGRGAPADSTACDDVADDARTTPSVRTGPISPQVLEPLRLKPEIEKLLLDIGMPADDSPIYNGKRRGADKPEEAARKFVIWARAIGAVGSYPAGVICALYGECAAADHRVPISDNRFLFALKHTAGIRRDVSSPNPKLHRWIIEPPEVVKPKPAPPLPKPIAKPALNKPRLLHRFVPDQEYSSPQLVQAKAREARRLGRARKQRGSRSHRFA